jgi:hypothetical protein
MFAYKMILDIDMLGSAACSHIFCHKIGPALSTRTIIGGFTLIPILNWI